MDWYKNSKKNIAPIPENFDVIEKSEDEGFYGWKFWAGANDWECGTTLMAFVIGNNKNGSKRIWVKVNNKQFPKENNNDQPKEILDKVKQWGDLSKETFSREFKKAMKNVPKSDYEYSPFDAAIDAIKSNSMKKFVEDWGIDELTWIEKSRK